MKTDNQHQGEPVTLPARMDENSVKGVYGYSSGWNACLDEIAKLGPLYPHTDPGEVERDNDRLTRELDARDRLRAQLAELLAAVSEHRKALKPLGLPLGDRLEEAALSASAELKENNNE